MPALPPYTPETLSRAEADALPGATVLEFGTNWCSICQGATPAIAQALAPHLDPHLDAQAATLRHLRVEDGPGRPLGRSYRVKLWPTLVMLQDGREVARVVRPQGVAEVAQALGVLVT
ncbi:MAG: thioredoxin [Burkholderiales bacterium]|nr:MAG: thioredoxin [Burkholderiales bacterium]